MWDANLGGGKHAFKIVISDLTTGQSGFMTASAANGFMNTNYVTCSMRRRRSTSSRCSTPPGRRTRTAGRCCCPAFSPSTRPGTSSRVSASPGRSPWDPTLPGRPATGPTRTRDRPTAPRRARKWRTRSATRRATRMAGRRRRTWSPAAWTTSRKTVIWTSTARRTTATGRPRRFPASGRRRSSSSSPRPWAGPGTPKIPVRDRPSCKRGGHLRAEHSCGLHGSAQGPGALLPVLHAGEGRRAVRLGVRQHEKRQQVRRRSPVRPPGAARVLQGAVRLCELATGQPELLSGAP